ncbi:MAG: glycosyltransferase family 25 protein [Alphaproteobacteria bacterium]|nr:glycosyltransferase family 25 protein [Alphaproteobacteria bacterium]
MQAFGAVLLNLDRDTVRRAHMESELARAGIGFTRQPGILGDAVPDDLRRYFFHPDGSPKTIMKRGEIGCYASHLRALTRIASGELGDAVLVMEDDLAFDDGFLETVAAAINAMPKGWDILRLSSPPRRAYVPLARLPGGRFLIRYSKIPNSAGAYLVTREGARKFIERGVRGLTFDDDLRRPWFHHLDTYGIVPPPARAGVLKSSIDAIETGRFDKGMSSRMERITRGDHFYMFKRLAYNIGNLGLGGWLFCVAVNLADMVVKPLRGRSIIHGAARLFPGVK